MTKQVIVMLFNTTFNNISVISWQSVLLVEETGVAGENHRPAATFLCSNKIDHFNVLTFMFSSCSHENKLS
jgi:hypothetical protein